MNYINIISNNTFDILTQFGIDVNELKVRVNTKCLYLKSIKNTPENPFNCISDIIDNLLRGEEYTVSKSILKKEVYFKCLNTNQLNNLDDLDDLINLDNSTDLDDLDDLNDLNNLIVEDINLDLLLN